MPHLLDAGGPDDEMVTIDAECFAETTLAWGIEIVPLGSEAVAEVWLPKSQCERDGEKRWSIPAWLAHKLGVV